jgi:hypothetical protein
LKTNPHTLIIAVTVLSFANAAYASNASNINVTTGYSNAGSQGNAVDYKSVVDAAVAISSVGYGSTNVDFYDNISNHSLFGGQARISHSSRLSIST